LASFVLIFTFLIDLLLIFTDFYLFLLILLFLVMMDNQQVSFNQQR